MPQLSVLLLPLASAILSRLAMLGTLLICARGMPPEEFGVFGLSTTVMAVMSGFVSGGDMVLNRFSKAGYNHTTATAIWLAYSGAVVIGSLATVIFGLGAALAMGVFTEHATAAWLTLLGGAVLGMGECIFAVLRARGHVKTFFLLRDILPTLATLTALLLLNPQQADPALALFAGFPAITAAVGIFLLRPWEWRPQLQRAIHVGRLIYRHHLSLALGNLWIRLYVYIDVLILAAVAPIALVGQYRLAAQVAVGFWIVQHFAFLGLPWQMRQRGDGAAFSQLAQRQRLLAAMTVLALLLAFPLLPLLLPFLGTMYASATKLFFLLLAIRATDLLWGPQHEMMVSNRLTRQDLMANIAAALSWLILFGILMWLKADHLSSALTASITAATFGHLLRLRALVQAGIEIPYGQPFGWRLPLLLAAGLAAAAWIF